MRTMWIALAVSATAHAQVDAPEEESIAYQAASAKARKVPMVSLQNRKRTFKLKVPKEWRLEEYAEEHPRRTLFELTLPDCREVCLFSIIDHLTAANPLGGPAWMEKYYRKAGKPEWKLRAKPFPHYVAQLAADSDTLGDVGVFVRANGHTIELNLRVPPDRLESATAALLASAATLQTTLPSWPPLSKEYRVKGVGPYRLAVHRSVLVAPAPWAKSIQAAQKICDRLHGRLPRPQSGEAKPVIYLHSERSQQESILPRLKSTTTTNSLCLSGLCVFALAGDPKEEDPAANLIYTIGEFNALWRWGTGIPMWVRVGERIVVANLVQTGKALPVVTGSRLAWRDDLELPKLSDLTVEASARDWNKFYRQAFFYTVYFHAGPKEIRKAYRAYLDGVRETCDPRGSASKHLEPLDYDKLREQATQFMREQVAPLDGR